MGCPAGRCRSCVFTRKPGNAGANLSDCNIESDPEVKQSYKATTATEGYARVTYGICSKYQLNPAALGD